MGESPDLREFMREIVLRSERTTNALIRQMERDSRIAREEQRLVREEHRVMIEKLNDLKDEDRAQRQALLRILDRLDGGDGGTQPAT